MRRFTTIIVMTTVAALAVAGNAPAQDLRSPDAQDSARAARAIDLRSPDARDAARASDAAKSSGIRDLRSPDARDTSGVSTFEPGAVTNPTVVAVPAATSFDWGAAGIGAAAMLGVIALAAGTLLVMSSRRRERRLPRAVG
jgi:hypothetical protein